MLAMGSYTFHFSSGIIQVGTYGQERSIRTSSALDARVHYSFYMVQGNFRETKPSGYFICSAGKKTRMISLVAPAIQPHPLDAGPRESYAYRNEKDAPGQRSARRRQPLRRENAGPATRSGQLPESAGGWPARPILQRRRQPREAIEVVTPWQRDKVQPTLTRGRVHYS